MPIELLINRERAAESLSISLRTLDFAVKQGLLKPTRVGRRVFFTEEELRSFASRDHARITLPASNG